MSPVVSNSQTSSNPDYTPATENIAGQEYQLMKLVDSTPTSTTPIGTAANPLHVQGTSVGGDVNIAEVGGVAVTDSVPVSPKSPLDRMALLPIVSDILVTAGCTTTVINIATSTSTTKAGDWVFFDSVGALALRQVARQITSVAANQVTVSPALPATPTNGVDRLTIYRQHIIPVNSGGTPYVSINESISLPVTHGGLTELAAAIGTVDSSSPVIPSGIQIAGDDPYAFDGPKVAAPNVINQSPAGTEFGLVTRNIPSGTQAVSAVSLPLPTGAATETTLAAINTKLVGGTTIGDVRLRDGAGNVLVSSTTTPGTSDRGLVGRNINYNYDSGSLAHFRAEGNSLYGTTYVTEKSATGANKSFNTGNSDTGTQRVVLAANQPTVRDSSGNAVASATTTPGASDRGLTTRSFAYLYDADGVKISASSTAPAYTAVGLNTRRPADVYIASSQEGTLTAPHGYYFYSSRTTAAGSTTTVINTTTDPSTVCRRGDKIRITSGTHAEGIYQEGVVSSVSSSAITLQFPLAVAPPTTRSVSIYKPISFAVGASGALLATVTASGPFPTYPVYANKFFCDKGELAFGSISGTYATIATTVSQIAVIKIVNGTNVPLMFSFDAGVTDWDMVPAGQSATLAAIQNGGYVDGSVDIQVKDIGSAAGSGSAYYFGYYF